MLLSPLHGADDGLAHVGLLVNRFLVGLGEEVSGTLQVSILQ